MATPQAINFMARYGRGSGLLALTRERVEQLGLPLMVRQNGSGTSCIHRLHRGSGRGDDGYFRS
jgi:3,4-dihydroxy-2-butanone 4-phosphate synthase